MSNPNFSLYFSSAAASCSAIISIIQGGELPKKKTSEIRKGSRGRLVPGGVPLVLNAQSIAKDHIRAAPVGCRGNTPARGPRGGNAPQAENEFHDFGDICSTYPGMKIISLVLFLCQVMKPVNC